jgi:hypothetical protein
MSNDRRAWQRCRPLWFRLPRLLRILWIGASVALGPVQRRWRFEPARIRALLLVRDLHSPLTSLVNGLLAQGLRAEHILLLDSGSSQPACLDTLSSLQQRGCRWIRLPAADQRYGPYAAWMCPELRREIRRWRYPYLLSDADLVFPATLPADWLQQLFASLNRHGGVLKVALPLQISDITADNRDAIRAHETALIQDSAYRRLSRLLLGESPSAAVCTTDTTLALYRPSPCFSTLSIRLPPCYALKHLPWYSHFCDSAEYRYYQCHKLSLFGEWSSTALHPPTGPGPPSAL